MRATRLEVEEMVVALMSVIRSSERARRKGDASRLATLFVIAASPERSPKAISEELGFHPSSVTRQIQALEEAGHVKVTRDPKDGRSCRVALTAAGQEEIERLREVGVQRFVSFVAGWSAEEVRTFTRLLAKFEQSKAETNESAMRQGKRWQQEK